MHSSHKLRNACENRDCGPVKYFFNIYTLYYPNKKTATNALSEAYQYLKKYDKTEGMSYARGAGLSYDSANAVISYKP